MFSGNTILSVLSAFLSPGGLVFGRMGDIVVPVSSTCSSRKLQRQSIRAVYVGRSLSRLDTVVRETVKTHDEYKLSDGLEFK